MIIAVNHLGLSFFVVLFYIMIIRRQKKVVDTKWTQHIFKEYRHVILLRTRCHALVVLFSR